MDDAFKSTLSIWQTDTPPRVWSILVTLFGDIAQSPDSHLSGKAVTAILTELNIKPEAIRVALHRLRNDGWISSRKVGRQSNYALTTWGLEQCAAATPQIYGPWTTPDRLYLIAPDPRERTPVPPDAAVQIAPGLFTSPQLPRDEMALHVPIPNAQSLPQWVQEKLFPPELSDAAQIFGQRVTAFQSHTCDLKSLPPIRVAALRTIIVHEWRRIILRVPDVPDDFQLFGSLDRQSRLSFVQALDRLPKPDLDDLNNAAT